MRIFLNMLWKLREGQSLLFRHSRKTNCERSPRLLLAASHPATARYEPVSDQSPDRQPAIRMTNLLPLNRRSRMIRNRHLANLLPHAAQLRGHLGAELEPAAIEFHARKQRAANHFVTGRLVVDAGSINKIGKMREQLRAQKKS